MEKELRNCCKCYEIGQEVDGTLNRGLSLAAEDLGRFCWGSAIIESHWHVGECGHQGKGVMIQGMVRVMYKESQHQNFKGLQHFNFGYGRMSHQRKMEKK